MSRRELVSWTLISHYNHDLKCNANIDESLRMRDHRGRKAETASLLDQCRGEEAVLETEELEKTLQTLYLDAIATWWRRQADPAQLELRITQLESNFAAAGEL